MLKTKVGSKLLVSAGGGHMNSVMMLSNKYLSVPVSAHPVIDSIGFGTLVRTFATCSNCASSPLVSSTIGYRVSGSGVAIFDDK